MRTPQALSVWWMGIIGCAAALVAPCAFAQPVARDDSFSTAQATPISIAAANGVLVNDSAAAGGALDAVLITNVTHGVLLFGADGSFFYLPNADFTGNDAFTYQAREGGVTLGNIATATDQRHARRRRQRAARGRGRQLHDQRRPRRFTSTRTTACWPMTRMRTRTR